MGTGGRHGRQDPVLLQQDERVVRGLDLALVAADVGQGGGGGRQCGHEAFHGQAP